MKIADLSAETIEKIKLVRWDRIIEKHEGPEDWESVFRYEQLEFLEVEGYPILLPVNKSHHSHISILRCIWSAEKNSVTLSCLILPMKTIHFFVDLWQCAIAH